MIGRPVCSRASASSSRPFSPSPWKLYGEVRGLNAPPRMIRAPAALTAWAVSSTCSRLSTEQGPAMTTSSLPPISTSPTLTMVSVGLKSRLACFHDFVIRATCPRRASPR